MFSLRVLMKMSDKFDMFLVCMSNMRVLMKMSENGLLEGRIDNGL